MAADLRLFPTVLLSLALAACGADQAAPGAPSLDDELAEGANGQDPLLAAVVQDPIMTDTQLSTRSNANAVRPPSQPYAAPIPFADVVPVAAMDDGALTKVPDAGGNCTRCATARGAITLAALAARQPDPELKRCAASLGYTAGWAARMPADLPLYRAAQVVEAAGTDAAGCRVRAVTFTTARPVDHMLDWYFTTASRGGYRSTHQADAEAHVLAGTRPGDRGSFVAFVRESVTGGSEIDLLVSDGR